jgi:integrase
MATHLNEALVRALEPPASGNKIIYDDADGGAKGVRGFGIRVTAAGSRSFVLNYRVAGVERRHTIGRWPTWTVTAARDEAKRLRRLVDQGHDPAQQRRQDREAPTVRELAERYKTEHLPKKTGERSEGDDTAMLDNEILPRIGSRKVADIHFGDMAALHKEITDSGRPVRANRVLALASKMFSLAMTPPADEIEPWRTQAQGNPCKGIERNPEHGRERYYSEAEIASIADALATYPGRSTANLVRFTMFTGCRPGEAMKAKWVDIDLDAGTWTKLGARTKARKVHRAPLNPPAVALLKEWRKHVHKDCPWIFPGRKMEAGGWEPLKQYRDCWSHVRDAAKLAPDAEGNAARVYDLRHSFATIGLGRGLSLPLIGKLLGHSQARTTQRYAHAADDPLREASEKVGETIAAAGKPGGATVTPIKAGGR